MAVNPITKRKAQPKWPRRLARTRYPPTTPTGEVTRVDRRANVTTEDSTKAFMKTLNPSLVVATTSAATDQTPETMPPGIEGANVFLRSGSLANTTIEEDGMRLERSDADTIIPHEINPDTEPSGFLAISFFTYDNSIMEKFPVEAIENAMAGIWEHGDQIKERYCKQHKCQEFLACNPEPFLLFPSQCDDPDDADKTLDWYRCTHWNNPKPAGCIPLIAKFYTARLNSYSLRLKTCD
ncbi:hypothetical protein LOZ58_006915 [Ophidiomyces ophidiicola]|nr:hypothetical protein LOZ58_006915 [Ophidiomyces ophidiicola]